MHRFTLYIFGIDDALLGAGMGLAGGLMNNLFAGSRQEDQQAFNSMAQLQAQTFNQREAENNRAFTGWQADMTRDFNRVEADKSRGFLDWQADKNRAYNSSEAEIARANQNYLFGRTMDFNAQSMQQQMDFQEKMANTSWQRGVADMRAAGINPILAYSKGGASAPAGGMASVSSGSSPMASSGSPGTATASSGASHGSQASSGMAHVSPAQVFDIVAPALSTARMVQELKNMGAQEQNIKAQTVSEVARAPNIRADTKLKTADEFLRQNQAATEAWRIPEQRAKGKAGDIGSEFFDSAVGRALTLAGMGGSRASDFMKPLSDLTGIGAKAKGLFSDRWP